MNDALNAVLYGADTSDADRCYEAIAAAEIVAASRGRACHDLPDEVKEWLIEHEICADDKLASNAVSAVEMVRNNSEAAVLWADAPDWNRGLNGLIRRLRAEAKVRRTAKRGPVLSPEVTEAIRQLRKHRAEVVFENGKIWQIAVDAHKARSMDNLKLTNSATFSYQIPVACLPL